MTEPRRARSSDALDTVREMIRSAGHEIRNSLNGVAVNVEVVRSRAGTGGVAKGEVASFAERASSQVAEASALSDGLLAFVGAVLAAEARGTLKGRRRAGAPKQVELMLYGDGAVAALSDIERLASRIGAVVEQHGQRVILTVSPEGSSHSKS
ncbi:MAG: hypothetical protein ACJ8AB_05965 [Gemmatimonadaceae bacterium]